MSNVYVRVLYAMQASVDASIENFDVVAVFVHYLAMAEALDGMQLPVTICVVVI